jgi:hypothetical protein
LFIFFLKRDRICGAGLLSDSDSDRAVTRGQADAEAVLFVIFFWDLAIGSGTRTDTRKQCHVQIKQSIQAT